MITLYDHRTATPVAYRTERSCVAIPGLGSVPVANPPPGVYPAGGATPIPAGERVVSEKREVRDGKSVLVRVTAKPSAATLAAEAEATAETARQRPVTAAELAALAARVVKLENR